MGVVLCIIGGLQFPWPLAPAPYYVPAPTPNVAIKNAPQTLPNVPLGGHSCSWLSLTQQGGSSLVKRVEWSLFPSNI